MTNPSGLQNPTYAFNGDLSNYAGGDNSGIMTFSVPSPVSGTISLKATGDFINHGFYVNGYDGGSVTN